MKVQTCRNYKEQKSTEEQRFLLFPARVWWKTAVQCDLRNNFGHCMQKVRGFVVPPVLHCVLLAALIAN